MTEEIGVKPNEPILTATSYLFDGATRILLANTQDGEKNPNKISLSPSLDLKKNLCRMLFRHRC